MELCAKSFFLKAEEMVKTVKFPDKKVNTGFV